MLKDILDLDIISKRVGLDWKKDREKMKIFVDEEYNVVDELSRVSAIKKDGFIQISDKKGEFVNIVNGERYTLNNPKQYSNKLYLFGPCIIEGTYVKDEYTVASLMRNNIDMRYYIKNCGNLIDAQNYIMRNQVYKKGDIVVIFALDNEEFKKNNMKSYSIINAYRNTENLLCNIDNILVHCNKNLMVNIAEEITNIFKESRVFWEDNKEYVEFDNITFGIERGLDISKELKEWLDYVKKYKIENVNKAGAIVMNCNPFTLGHRYLVEYAKSKVDVLYIFVVEEDKSFFKFKDRLNMVKLGVEDLENVVVLPSGKYIISTETLPGYFSKEENPYVEYDATEDLEIFSKIIAKEFDIKVRFAGEEPNDAFTRRYNDYMKLILPNNGIEFVEIPRKMYDEKNVISASLVRKYMKDNSWSNISELVLPKVLEYLRENY